MQRFEDELALRCPVFRDDADSASYAQNRVFAQDLVLQPGMHRAVRLLAVLAVGDLDDLFREVRLGAGRAAMRSARTLIEHCVNMHTVLQSEEAADRYIAYLEQGALFLNPPPGVELLSRGTRTAAVRQAERAAASAQPLWDDALAKYGRSFERKWHPATLYDRAVEAGDEELYQLYRVGSAVVHGSAAGAVGQFRLDSSGDVATYAAGRVPALVPHAFVIGADAYLRLLTHVMDARPTLDYSMPGSLVSQLLTTNIDAVWKLSVQVADHATQPVDEKMASYLAFSRRGRTRWYLTLPEAPDLWCRATAVGDEGRLAKVEALLKTVADAYIEQGGEFSVGGWAAFQLPWLGQRPEFGRGIIPSGTMPLIVMTPEGFCAGFPISSDDVADSPIGPVPGPNWGTEILERATGMQLVPAQGKDGHAVPVDDVLLDAWLVHPPLDWSPEAL